MNITQQHTAPTRPRPVPARLVFRAGGKPVWAAAWHGITLFPFSLGRLVRGLVRGQWRTALRGLCGTALGAGGWFIAVITGMAALNGALYPLVDAHDYQHSWGGPTLMGAWAAHAVLAVPLVLATAWALRGLAALDTYNQQELSGAQRRWWPVPLSLAVTFGVAQLVQAWASQR
ncbi:hypothetical protein [Streptomyces sp. NPDC001415]